MNLEPQQSVLERIAAIHALIRLSAPRTVVFRGIAAPAPKLSRPFKRVKGRKSASLRERSHRNKVAR